MTTLRDRVSVPYRDMDITCTGPSGNGFLDTQVPRADECMNCHKPRAKHAQDKCLFGSTMYRAISYQEWIFKFCNWVAGRNVEDVLAALAFNATGGEKE